MIKLKPIFKQLKLKEIKLIKQHPEKVYNFLVQNFNRTEHPGVDYIVKCFDVEDEEEYQHLQHQNILQCSLEDNFQKSPEELSQNHNISLEDAKILSRVYKQIDNGDNENYDIVSLLKKYISNPKLFNTHNYLWQEIMFTADDGKSYKEFMENVYGNENRKKFENYLINYKP